jgi:hypothetical protein
VSRRFGSAPGYNPGYRIPSEIGAVPWITAASGSSQFAVRALMKEKLNSATHGDWPSGFTDGEPTSIGIDDQTKYLHRRAIIRSRQKGLNFPESIIEGESFCWVLHPRRP